MRGTEGLRGESPRAELWRAEILRSALGDRIAAQASGWGAALRGCALVLAIGACGGSQNPEAVAAGGVEQVRVQGLTFSVPEVWKSQTPQTSMRLAEYTIPGEGGDASLVLFRFAGGGGSARANVDRWISQFQSAGGGSAGESATVKTEERGGLTLTTLDVSGSFEGQQMPGAPAQPAIEQARLLALVVEGASDPYFFKLLGPASTVARWADAWGALAASIKTGGPGQ